MLKMFFFIDNDDFITKKNVVVNHNKLLKICIDFNFSLFAKFFKIKFYMIQQIMKLSLNFCFYCS